MAMRRRPLPSASKIVARASRPLWHGHPARARERDAPAVGGETPALLLCSVGAFSWFLGARQGTGMSDCFENFPAKTPHPSRDG